MTVYVESHHGDGSSTLVDSSDGARFKVTHEQRMQVLALANEDQRAKLEEFKQANIDAGADARQEQEQEHQP